MFSGRVTMRVAALVLHTGARQYKAAFLAPAIQTSPPPATSHGAHPLCAAPVVVAGTTLAAAAACPLLRRPRVSGHQRRLLAHVEVPAGEERRGRIERALWCGRALLRRRLERCWHGDGRPLWLVPLVEQRVEALRSLWLASFGARCCFWAVWSLKAGCHSACSPQPPVTSRDYTTVFVGYVGVYTRAARALQTLPLLFHHARQIGWAER